MDDPTCIDSWCHPQPFGKPFCRKLASFSRLWPGCQAKRLRAGLGRVELRKQAQTPVRQWPAWTFPRWTEPNWRKPWRTLRIVPFYSDQTLNNFRILLIPLNCKFPWHFCGRLFGQDASDQLSKIQHGSVRVKQEPKSPVSFLEPPINKNNVYSHACICTYRCPLPWNPFEVPKPHEPSIFDAATQPADSSLDYVEKIYIYIYSIWIYLLSIYDLIVYVKRPSNYR
jgi:hypothetical protein